MNRQSQLAQNTYDASSRNRLRHRPGNDQSTTTTTARKTPYCTELNVMRTAPERQASQVDAPRRRRADFRQRWRISRTASVDVSTRGNDRAHRSTPRKPRPSASPPPLLLHRSKPLKGSPRRCTTRRTAPVMRTDPTVT